MIIAMATQDVLNSCHHMVHELEEKNNKTTLQFTSQHKYYVNPHISIRSTFQHSPSHEFFHSLLAFFFQLFLH